MKSLIILALSVVSISSFAGDINWSGKYQLESQLLKNPNLQSSEREYSYLNHHLVLNPHIVAADGITIHTRFDIFNNSDYPNSQFGEFLGGSSEPTPTSSGSAADGELESEQIAVTELYLSWVQQFGSFLAGRAPVQFGLGITHNAGNGEFDHWFDRKDLIAYKFVLGNIFVMPMYGKVKEGDAENDDDIKEYLLHVGYENLDTDLEIGLFFQQRKAHTGGNNIVVPTTIYNEAANGLTHQNVKTYNLFVKKKTGAFSVGVEASMQSGGSGLLTTASGAEIEIDAHGIAGEIGYAPENSKWKYDIKLGMISGDDMTTPDTYEGYLVDRNYDIALLMFNYALGSGTDTIGNENYVGAVTNNNTKVDVGQISNTLYFAPGFNWKWSDKWDIKGRFTYAQLSQERQTGQSKDLGYEFDLGLYYRPFERFVVGIDMGYLVTGDAFQAGTVALQNENAYGFITKAAINF